MKIKKFAPIFVIFTFSLLAWIFNLHHYFNFETLRTHHVYLKEFIETHLVVALVIYITVYILFVALSLPAATFMTLLGGFLFGQGIGTSAVVLSATVGASLLFISAKMASQDLINKKVDGFALKMQKGFQESALSYLLTLRLIPLFPFVAVNLAAALFQIPLRTFLLGTFFGIIPGSFVYVSMGVAIQEVIQQPDFSPNLILDPKILLAFIGLGILSLLPALYKHLKNNRG